MKKEDKKEDYVYIINPRKGKEFEGFTIPEALFITVDVTLTLCMLMMVYVC